MKKINPQDYDYLWTVHHQTYLFNSIILIDEYLKRDFIVYLTQDFSTFYVSKTARKRLSELGLIFFRNKFSGYALKVKREIHEGKIFLNLQRNLKLSKMKSDELAGHFLRAVLFTQKMFSYYFWTEYFCLDKVAEIIKSQPATSLGKLLSKRINQMGQLKYQQRELLNVLFFSNKFMSRYYHEIARHLHFSADQVNNYNFRELVDLLKGKGAAIFDRTDVVKGKFNAWQDISGKKAKKIIDQFEKFDPNSRVIKGQPGNVGYYKGIVKKVDFSLKAEITNRQIKEMKKGEVLVSGSTGPEMILACKKAGAIITDEGGITSHAAIVSRELKIPSVIATKIATRVLKDGDVVEVDADHGIINRL
jgi:phosphohistidine swiveling domain-containing protein